jgi:hypothetical protein
MGDGRRAQAEVREAATRTEARRIMASSIADERGRSEAA